MQNKLIYKKRFPKDPFLETLKKQEQADAYNAFQGQFATLTEMLDHIEQATTYTPLPYKISCRKKFIQAAIELSEHYQLDLEITQQKGAVCADYFLKNGTFFRKLNSLLAMADAYSFHTQLCGSDIVFSVTYFTHRRERNGIVFAP